MLFLVTPDSRGMRFDASIFVVVEVGRCRAVVEPISEMKKEHDGHPWNPHLVVFF